MQYGGFTKYTKQHACKKFARTFTRSLITRKMFAFVNFWLQVPPIKNTVEQLDAHGYITACRLNITSRWLVLRSTPREGKRWGPGDQTVWAPPVDVLGPRCNKHSTEEQGKWQTKSALLHNNILLVPHFTHLYSKSNFRRSVTRLTNAIPTLLKRKFSSNFSVKLRKKERRTNN